MDPSGIFSTSYARDSALVRTRAQWLALALFGAALLLYPWLASPRLVAVANLMLKMGYDRSQIHYELYG